MDEQDEGHAMSEYEAEDFQGFSDNDYQHTMHTLAWISLWLIMIFGVGAGILGFVIGLAD